MKPETIQTVVEARLLNEEAIAAESEAEDPDPEEGRKLIEAERKSEHTA